MPREFDLAAEPAHPQATVAGESVDWHKASQPAVSDKKTKVDIDKDDVLFWAAELAALSVAAVTLVHKGSNLIGLANGAEITSFVRKNAGLFAQDEARVLTSINWKAEARLPSLVDSHNPIKEKLIIGKLTDLENRAAAPNEFVLRWPDEKYTAFSKAQNLSMINRWLQRGGQIVDVSPAQTQFGFLQGERAFIAQSKYRRPGQYLHQMSGLDHPPTLP